MATAPPRSGFAEINSSRRVLGSPLSYRVGPWPTILGWTSNLYSSIRSSRSSSVASLPLPRSTPFGVASLSFCTPVRRLPAMWWLLVQGKSFRVEDTTYFGLGIQLDRPLAHRRRCLRVAAGDRWPVALHHLVGDAAPQHRPALVHEAGEEGVCLVVGDSFPVVDAAVQGDVDTEGQESRDVPRSRYPSRRNDQIFVIAVANSAPITAKAAIFGEREGLITIVAPATRHAPPNRERLQPWSCSMPICTGRHGVLNLR